MGPCGGSNTQLEADKRKPADGSTAVKQCGRNTGDPVIAPECSVFLVDRSALPDFITTPTAIDLSGPGSKGVLTFSAEVLVYTQSSGRPDAHKKSKPKTKIDVALPSTVYIKAIGPGPVTLTLKAHGKESLPCEMTAVQLDMVLCRAEKKHSEVFFSSTMPKHTALSRDEQVGRGRLLVLQDESQSQGRAKLIVKEPDPAVWKADLRVVLTTDSQGGEVTIFSQEVQGKDFLCGHPVSLGKEAFGDGDLVLWVEGTKRSNAHRDVRLHLGVEGKNFKAKGYADRAFFTVIDIVRVLPGEDRVYVNIPMGTSRDRPEKPWWDTKMSDAARRSGREIEATAEISPALLDVAMMFSLIPDPNNRGDLFVGAKHKRPDETDMPVMTNNQDPPTSARLTLSGYGGDRFRVAAYLQEAPPGVAILPQVMRSRAGWMSGVLTVWKKVYYRVSVMRMHDKSTDYERLFDEEGMKGIYKNSFIELVRDGDNTYADYSPSSSNADHSLPPQTFVIAFVDTIHKRSFFVEHKGVKTVFMDGYDHAFNLAEERSWQEKCFYHGTIKRLSEDHQKAVTLKRRGPDWVFNAPIKVDITLKAFDGPAGLQVDRARMVSVAMRFRWARQTQIGRGKSDQKRTTTPASDVFQGCDVDAMKASTLHTVLHEIGHYFGLVTPRLPDDTNSKNTLHIDIGEGPHCLRTKPCIMVGVATDGALQEFCENCDRALRALDLSQLPPIVGEFS